MSDVAKDEYRDRGYECIISAAQSCATAGDQLDDSTRDCARDFLRSEFKRWQEGAEQIPDESSDSEDDAE